MARRKRRHSARFHTPIQILYPPESTNTWEDAAGDWTVLIETRAEIWGTRGAERVESMADHAGITHHARVMFDPRINRSQRVKILADNTDYEIVFLNNVDYRNREIIMDLRQL